MRWMVTALTIAAATCGGASGAEPPAAMTVDDLQQLCTGQDHVSENACRIYILGVTQGIAVGLHLGEGGNTGARPCVPAGVSAEALEQTVKGRLTADLTAHPKDGEREASGFIASVLGRAFPCTKRSQRSE